MIVNSLEDTFQAFFDKFELIEKATGQFAWDRVYYRGIVYGLNKEEKKALVYISLFKNRKGKWLDISRIGTAKYRNTHKGWAEVEYKDLIIVNPQISVAMQMYMLGKGPLEIPISKLKTNPTVRGFKGFKRIYSKGTDGLVEQRELVKRLYQNKRARGKMIYRGKVVKRVITEREYDTDNRDVLKYTHNATIYIRVDENLVSFKVRTPEIPELGDMLEVVGKGYDKPICWPSQPGAKRLIRLFKFDGFRVLSKFSAGSVPILQRLKLRS